MNLNNICKYLAIITVINVILPDPIPYIDEIFLISLLLFKCKDFRQNIAGAFALVMELLFRMP